MEAMPRPRPPHLHRETNRHGNAVWYVRVGKGPAFVSAPLGTPDFEIEYRAAIAGEKPMPAGKHLTGTLSWLIERYRDSGAWTKLSMATRRQRENIFQNVTKTAGLEKIGHVDRKAIVAGRDRRRETPNAARHFVQAMRGLFEWAVQAGYASADSTADVDTPRPASEGFETWPPEWCALFEKRWPLGTRERVAYDVLFFTGLRRGDAVRFGRPHVKNSIDTIRTGKPARPLPL
jgi:site-specific recombinase XerC